MANKMLYVRKGDQSFWDRAEKLAEGRGVPLSVFIADLLRNHIYSLGSKETADPTPAEMLHEIETLAARVRTTLEPEE